MTIYQHLILAFWTIFIAYWWISAMGAKRNIGGPAWWRAGGLRLGVVVLLLLALRDRVSNRALRSAGLSAADLGVVPGVIGVALCAVGIGLAVWARFHLGRNWGLPMSRKENPELVTTGPYSRIRHPIYTGVLLAMLGSTLGMSVAWLLALIPFGAYFVYSARREEALMLEQFPQQYAAYRRRTKMLLPYLW
ncbi:MAG TPA: isoprenylcysteine carboxylmethyltransferase family protein [Stellaceae bacterium]|nr:isoprenylcysteine carboxylmethyltransferase family protein [Stellaceae bacterium]